MVLYVFPLVFGILYTLYFYRFFRRAAEAFCVDVTQKPIKMGIAAASVLVGSIGCNPMNTSGLVVAHLCLFSLFASFLNFCIQKINRNRHPLKLWKKLYLSGILPVAATAALMIFGFWNMFHVAETRYQITTRKEIRPEGYRIVLIADVHAGVSLDVEGIQAICDEISEQEPDIVVLCGDIVDNHTDSGLLKEVFAAFGSIDSEFGVYYVYGNHDRPMRLLKSGFTLEEINEAITDSGIQILKDEVVTLNNEITIIGREDAFAQASGNGRKDIFQLVENADKKTYLITLDHQPNDYQNNAAAGVDLMLSGHTHGGQIWPLNYILEMLPVNDALYGNIRVNDTTRAIVTSGFAGWAYPIKTAAPAEYVIIDVNVEK
ncbi:MAG: metallophosphoesterase [Faecousia sp.]